MARPKVADKRELVTIKLNNEELEAIGWSGKETKGKALARFVREIIEKDQLFTFPYGCWSEWIEGDAHGGIWLEVLDDDGAELWRIDNDKYIWASQDNPALSEDARIPECQEEVDRIFALAIAADAPIRVR